MDENQNSVLKFFYEICKIPRESGNEKGMQNYLINFAKKRNLKYFADSFNNIIIYKKTCDKEPIILHSHTDMVCVKTPNAKFDFSKDAIEPQIKRGYLSAKNTSLGADNGIGLCTILSILDSSLTVNIEAVFTATEETTMQGAYNLDISKLNSKKLICLDGFCENEIIVSSASFTDFYVKASKNKQKIKSNAKIYSIEISGLQGGHSGYDIDKNRGSSHKLMAEFLLSLPDINLISFEGGKNFNVIPSKTTSTISTSINFRQLRTKLNKFGKFYKKLYRKLKVSCKEVETENKNYMALESGINFISFISKFSQGVLMQDANLNVLASQNISEVSAQNGYLKIGVRCAKKQLQDFYLKHLINLVKKCKLNGKILDTQPAFNSYKNSKIVSLLTKLNNKSYQKSMHIGVELGVLQNKIKGLDAVIISPTIFDAHSVKERVKLSTITSTYNWLKNFLQTY